MADLTAPEGWTWLCGACGKTSATHYGTNARNGWDESCMLNSFLIEVEALHNIREREEVSTPWHVGIMTKGSTGLFARPPEFLVDAVARTKEAAEKIMVVLKASDPSYSYELREIVK